MLIGEVRTFPNVQDSKEQALKVLEEAAEVFGAWQFRDTMILGGAKDKNYPANKEDVLDECADVIQATCNLIAALGVNDFKNYIKKCEQRNEDRGRYDVQESD